MVLFILDNTDFCFSACSKELMPVLAREHSIPSSFFCVLELNYCLNTFQDTDDSSTEPTPGERIFQDLPPGAVFNQHTRLVFQMLECSAIRRGQNSFGSMFNQKKEPILDHFFLLQNILKCVITPRNTFSYIL